MHQALVRYNPVSSVTPAEEIRAKICEIEHRQRWLWSFTVLATLLLALCIAYLRFPELLTQAGPSFSSYLSLAAHRLLWLVLVFNIYVLYQQIRIYRIQRQLAGQVEALGKIQSAEELYKLASFDALTGLYNRGTGERRLAEEISRCLRYFAPLTVLLIDLNGMQSVNDTFGHAAGDELIKYFAHCLRKSTRGYDVAIRLGGDEFLIVLPECKPDGVPHILERLNGLQIDCAGKTIPISFCAGWANYKPGELLEEFLKRADDALEAEKRRQKSPMPVEANKQGGS
jgi:diguanylate cyclase (GGDEF)-like protein